MVHNNWIAFPRGAEPSMSGLWKYLELKGPNQNNLEGLGFRVEGLGFRVWGLGFGV